MKTDKLLFSLLFFLVLLGIFGRVFAGPRQDDGTESGNLSGLINTECKCDCGTCRNCTNKQTEHESGNYEIYIRIMSAGDFADLKKLISDRTFESTKLAMAKNVINVNFFSTDQVRQLLALFTFESSKLEISKYMFKNTVDKNNYFKLFDLFTFESSVIELDEFIRKGDQ